ncbi:MAG: DUF790 family protein [Planctomycetes bacterium]|nr:DUF790 family protein [Planctomycetota bacterium]
MKPLPRHLLACTFADGELTPVQLTAHDLPWLRDLLLDAEAFVGRPRDALLRHWARSDHDPRAGSKLRPARHVLLQALSPPVARRDRSRLRRALFTAAASGLDRAPALAAIAVEFGIAPAAIEHGLFGDLPHERPLQWPAPAWSASDLQLRTNTASAGALLATATAATLQLRGAARAVLRTTWLLGAHFELLGHRDGGSSATLRWRPLPNDPRAGRRLVGLLPVLPWARRFELRAECHWRTRRGRFVLGHGDALLPGPAPAPFDSELERRFARDFVQQAPDWQLLREPVPIACGQQLAFPDFELRRRGSATVWWLELAGLRDPAALPGKLALLQQQPNYLLAVPRAACTAPLPDHPRLLRFGRHVAVADVLARCGP